MIVMLLLYWLLSLDILLPCSFSQIDSFRRLVCCPSGTFTPTLLLTEALRLCPPGLLSVRQRHVAPSHSLAFASVSLSSELLPSPINSDVGLGLINQCLRR